MQEINLADNAEATKKLELLYELYMTKLLYVAENIFRNPYDAEEMVQSAFIRVMDILDEIEEPESKRTYALLVTIVKNLCYDYIRKQKHEELVEFDDVQLEVADNCTPEQIYVEKEGEAELVRMLYELPEKYREPMLLYYIDEIPIREVADILEITQNLVSVRLARGRECLYDKIMQQQESSCYQILFRNVCRYKPLEE
ncbi:MAG: RNA polymerase sigma factor [Lachnospiraceae bacterium]